MNENIYDWSDEKIVDFSELKSKTFAKVFKDEEKQSIVFQSENEEYALFHDQDCSESVSIDDIHGELSWLENAEIIYAEESSNCGSTDWGTCTWTFYKLGTAKGWVDVRFYGESNGYYSESASLHKREKRREEPELIENEFGEKWTRSKKLEEIVKKCLEGNSANMTLDFAAEVDDEGFPNGRYVARIFGGLNGNGIWRDYLRSIDTFFMLMNKHFKRVYLLDLKNDCPDDTFALRICFRKPI